MESLSTVWMKLWNIACATGVVYSATRKLHYGSRDLIGFPGCVFLVVLLRLKVPLCAGCFAIAYGDDRFRRWTLRREKRAENADSTRDAVCKKIGAKSNNRTEFALAA